jgi:hypothetical protein
VRGPTHPNLIRRSHGVDPIARRGARDGDGDRPHREIHDFADFLGVGFAERSAEDSEILSKDVNEAAVNAAEAGNNYYYAYLQSTTVATLNCQPVTQTIATAPATASFTATPTFYDATGAVMPCSSATPFTSTYYPSSVAITTTGHGPNSRTMQTFIRLTPVYGGFGQAILSRSGATFPNRRLRQQRQ